MLKIYEDIKEFVGNLGVGENEYKFSKNCYLLKVYDESCELYAEKGIDSELLVTGSVSLVAELVKNMISLGLSFDSYYMTKELSATFNKEYVNILGGHFEELECPIKGYVSMKYVPGNICSCVLAGGCFWCVGKPYYEYDGVITVYFGYTGGNKIMPEYEEVKSQTTHHLEAIKLIFDQTVITYEDLLDIYFETIDPFDDKGQFIDRGESYTTCIFYKDDDMKNIINSYIKSKEVEYGKKICVKVLPETIFYMAEEYHQDYALKNPELMEKELIESGRKKTDEF